MAQLFNPGRRYTGGESSAGEKDQWSEGSGESPKSALFLDVDMSNIGKQSEVVFLQKLRLLKEDCVAN